ncbi:MAG: hypothetical protein UY48_C0006G0041 [Candidatus Gottesmanbacteria bacterium GW2011_GWB1_49_7]|uniref:Uncharacterized protein n=1 Tax=Candidatus Gottesmanbacteria bacterium GW2011_GWB1_49_7 TaxID=1618448 RepID=A0A0G1W2P4_9BACT|nr:MAG: hypothetical protein UY48_C0006G0041 [Candidatus Gottesmanbacteria bacterium GW2011_GWB1_49_7]
MLDATKILQGLNDEIVSAELRVAKLKNIEYLVSSLLKLEGWNEEQEADWMELCKIAANIGYPRLERHGD